MGSKQLPIKWAPGVERPGLEVNHSYHLVPRLGMSGATPLFPHYASMVYTGTFFPPKIVKIYP
jgi:hypothetical protein